MGSPVKMHRGGPGREAGLSAPEQTKKDGAAKPGFAAPDTFSGSFLKLWICRSRRVGTAPYFRTIRRFMPVSSPSAERSNMGKSCPNCQWVWPQ